jgi:hypothetical protein
MGEPGAINLSTLNYVRTGHDFLRKARPDYKTEDIDLINGYLQHVLAEAQKPHETFKVGLMFVCINYPYWQYLKPVVDGVKNMFLPGHDTEIMLWSDLQNLPENKDVNYGATVFPVESIEWPYPTLMRYQYFLEQKEYLKKFDYVFYLDLDMRIVNVVGDEILPKNGLMMAQHPMYATRQNLWFPYEPNPDSTAHFKLPGRYIEENGKKVFQPLYAAGGFQGGRTAPFIEAMEAMDAGIKSDLSKGYIARWNDESHWNKYLFDHPPEIVLGPDYVYPDSMIADYYEKIWGRKYNPRIITLTKPFSTSKEGGQAAQELMKM